MGRTTPERGPARAGGRPRVLFYFPHCREMTGAARSLLALAGHLGESAVAPLVVVHRESPLPPHLDRLGIPFEVVDLPEFVDRGALSRLRRGSPRYVARGVLEFEAHQRRLASVAERVGARALWTRNVEAVVQLRAAAGRLALPLVWDIGVEKPSVGVVRALHYDSLRRASVVVTQTPSQATQIFGEDWRRRFAPKIRALVPGIEPRRVDELEAARAAVAEAGPPTDLLVAASIHPRKNQRMLLEAVVLLRRRHPDLRVRLAGPVADRAYQAELEEFVARAGLGARVEFLGWRDDVPRLMAAAGLLIVSSEDEGLAHVVREGMWLGCPVVSTPVGGALDVIEHGQTGWVTAEVTAESLAATLELVLDAPDEVRRVGAAARERARSLFSHRRWLETYATLLEGLVADGRARRAC